MTHTPFGTGMNLENSRLMAGDECRIYPNPTVDSIMLSSTEGRPGGQAKIFDCNGCLKKIFDLGEGTIRLSVADLRSGIYTVLIEAGGVFAHGRFLKV